MIYLLTHGEYSDFTIDGLYEGPAGLVMSDLVHEYAQLHNLKAYVHRAETTYRRDDEEYKEPDLIVAFSQWLLTKGLVPIEHEELHTGDGSYVLTARKAAINALQSMCYERPSP